MARLRTRRGRPGPAAGWLLLLALVFLSACGVLPIRVGDDFGGAAHFIGLTNFSRFSRAARATPGEVVLMSPEVRTRFLWDDLVVSWNVRTPPGSGFKVEARAIRGGRATRFYNLGLWAEDTATGRRESVRGQKDDDGEVDTDTLVLRQRAGRLQLRITMLGSDTAVLPGLRFLGLSFLDQGPPRASRGGPRAVGRQDLKGLGRAKVLPVPERSQRSYPGGRDWCSPTCVSMVLGYWAAVLGRPELDLDVPAVAAGVYDPNWPGTGNWPFNTALAGSRDGMRAYVTRLANEGDLQTLVSAGVPPVLSVSFDLLQGKTEDQGNGHLVVCAGFTAEGDMVVHDPWALVGKGETVRRVVPLGRVLRAWARSRQTVYLIYPESWPVPQDRSGRW